MGVGKTYDHPPLLAPGRHVMTLADIQARFVDAFPGVERRRALFRQLEEFLFDVSEAGIVCEIWLNGSFVTEKEEPRDLDVTIILEPDVAAALTEYQQGIIEQISAGTWEEGVDSFVFAKLPRDHPDYADEALDPAYHWCDQYGRETSELWLKGYVVLKLGETDVGLRICR